jgi:flagellar export protein FliJ
MERSSRRALATAMGNVVAVEQRIAAAAESLQQCEDHGRGVGAAAQLARSLELGLTRYQWRLQRELRAAEAQLDRARTDWTERRRDEQVLQKLRETAKTQWRATALRQEQHELEELARLRAGAPGHAHEEKP